MPQIDFDGANSAVKTDKIQGQSGTTVTVTTGHNLAGSGSGLTALNAANIASGTLPMARLSGTLPALNGSALTALNATQLTSGTMPIARLGNDVIDSQHYAAGSIDNEHLADDAVGVAELSATGTASSSTFLRGDNAWAVPSGGKVLQAQIVYDSSAQTLATATYTATGLSVAITCAATSSKVLCFWNMEALLESGEAFGTRLTRDGSAIQTSPQLYDVMAGGVGRSYGAWAYLDSPSSTSAVTYAVQVGSYSGSSIGLNDGGTTHLLLLEIGA